MTLKKILSMTLILICLLLAKNGHKFVSLFILGVGVSVYVGSILNKLAKKEHVKNSSKIKKIFKIYKVLVLLIVALFMGVEGLILHKAYACKDTQLDINTKYVLVLGSSLNGYEISDTLKSRLDKAVDVYKENEDINIIVSGGITNSFNASEASVMYRYLVDNGVNPGKVILEDQALSTFDNFSYTKQILNKLEATEEKILIITSDFHLLRATMLANAFDIKNYGLGSDIPNISKPNYHIRELLAILKDFIKIQFIS